MVADTDKANVFSVFFILSFTNQVSQAFMFREAMDENGVYQQWMRVESEIAWRT